MAVTVKNFIYNGKLTNLYYVVDTILTYDNYCQRKYLDEMFDDWHYFRNIQLKLGKDLTIGENTVEAKTLQQVLDAIFPYLVPLALTFGCYYLIKHRKMSPLSTILILFVLGFILGALGWMA